MKTSTKWLIGVGAGLGAIALLSGRSKESGQASPVRMGGPARTYEEVMSTAPGAAASELASTNAYVDAGAAVSRFNRELDDLWLSSLELFEGAGMKSILSEGACDEPCEE